MMRHPPCWTGRATCPAFFSLGALPEKGVDGEQPDQRFRNHPLKAKRETAARFAEADQQAAAKRAQRQRAPAEKPADRIHPTKQRVRNDSLPVADGHHVPEQAGHRRNPVAEVRDHACRKTSRKFRLRRSRPGVTGRASSSPRGSPSRQGTDRPAPRPDAAPARRSGGNARPCPRSARGVAASSVPPCRPLR